MVQVWFAVQTPGTMLWCGICPFSNALVPATSLGGGPEVEMFAGSYMLEYRRFL